MCRTSAFWAFSSNSHEIIASVTKGSQSQEKGKKKDYFLFALSNFFDIAKSFTLITGNLVRQEQVPMVPGGITIPCNGFSQSA